MSVPPLILALLQRKHYIPDAALLLLQFLSIAFKVLGRISPQLSDINQHFPGTLYQLRKILGHSSNSFVRYVSCKKCSSVYKYSECVEKIGSRVLPKLCQGMPL